MSAATLKKEFNAHQVRYSGLSQELSLDSGDSRRERVTQIAEALRRGEGAPDLHLNRAARQMERDGVMEALRSVALDLVAELGKDRRRIDISLLPLEGLTADKLVEEIEFRLNAADLTHTATQDALAERRRYEAALKAFNEARAQEMMHGSPPQVASERAKQSLGAQADDLWIGRGMDSTAHLGDGSAAHLTVTAA